MTEDILKVTEERSNNKNRNEEFEVVHRKIRKLCKEQWKTGLVKIALQ